MATPAQQQRIDAEARLLQAVADDNLEGLADVLHGPVPAKDLLRLRVKPTFNDPTDDTAFFHSVASFGLSFGLGENAAQLAARNDCQDTATILEAAADGEGRELYETRISAEAELLAAIRSDSGEQARRVMKNSPDRLQLARVVVKDAYHNAADQGAIYHLVASYGLKFQIGDTLYDLAKRNGCESAARALQRFQDASVLRLKRLTEEDSEPKGPAPPPADVPMDLKVKLTNAMSGEDVCTVSASSQWTLALLARAAASEAPAPGACRVFLKGAAALSANTVLGDLQEDAEDVIQLSTVVLSSVHGIYTATVKLGDLEAAGLGPGPGLGPRRLIDAVPRGRDPPAHLGLQLDKDGTATFHFKKHPFDRGHCAPPSGGRWVHATGKWTYSVPGVEVVLKAGTEGHYMRGMKSDDGTFQQEQAILLSMVKEGQFEVVESQARLAGGSPAAPCPVGVQLVKKEGIKSLKELPR